MASVIHIDTPGVTIEEFSRRTGMPVATIRKKLSQGELPVIRTGLNPNKREAIIINLLKYAQMADSVDFKHPLLDGG